MLHRALTRADNEVSTWPLPALRGHKHIPSAELWANHGGPSESRTRRRPDTSRWKHRVQNATKNTLKHMRDAQGSTALPHPRVWGRFAWKKKPAHSPLWCMSWGHAAWAHSLPLTYSFPPIFKTHNRRRKRKQLLLINHKVFLCAERLHVSNEIPLIHLGGIFFSDL